MLKQSHFANKITAEFILNKLLVCVQGVDNVPELFISMGALACNHHMVGAG